MEESSEEEEDDAEDDLHIEMEEYTRLVTF